MKILVVEDEREASAFIAQGLSEHGYTVEVACSGTEGLAAAVRGGHDLLILDIMLPDVDGLAVLAGLRASRQVPVLMLTARGDTAEKVRAFDLGADDYLVKPFDFAELLARLRALLKRGTAPMPTGHVLRVGDLELDAVGHRATRGGRRIDLSAKEFALLALLLRKSGEVLTRTQIASQVWDIQFDCESNVVEVAIRRLRAKIDDPFPEKLLHTVRGGGYTLERRS